MTIVATLKDGRIISRAAITPVILSTAGNAALTATFSDLRKVEYILQWNITTNPAQNIYGPRDTWIAGNMAGTTVYAAGATTVSGEGIAIGY